MSTEPDPHLLAALRHAPDADLSAPADVSAQIRAAAWRAVAGTAPAQAPVHAPLHALPRSPARGLAAWWRKRSAPQAWGASGALATVLMAGVMGLIWQQERPGPGRPADTGATPATEVATARVSTPDVTAMPMPMPVPVPLPAPASKRASSEPAAARRQDPAKATQAAPAARSTPPIPTLPSAQPVTPPAELQADAQALPPVSMPERSAEAKPQEQAALRAPPPPAPTAAPSRLTQDKLADRSRATGASRAELKSSAAEASASAWQQMLGAQGGPLVWGLDGAPARPVPADELRALAAWSDAAWQPSPPDSTSQDGPALLLQRDGVPVARLWLQADAVRVCLVAPTAAQRCAHVALGAERSQALRVWWGR